MTQTILIMLFAVGAVALLVLGYWIVYFFRSRHMQSQSKVPKNGHTKAAGVDCAVLRLRDEAPEGIPTFTNECAALPDTGCGSRPTERKPGE